MDYKNYYKQASTKADEIIAGIRSGEASKQSQQKLSEIRKQSSGFMSARPQARPEEEEGDEEMDAIVAEYMAQIRAGAQDQAPDRRSNDREEGPTRLQSRGESASRVSNPEAASEIYAGLVDRGLPDHVAKAFVLNFQDESGLRTDVVESEPNVHGTRGKGLYQLTGSRREAFEDIYGTDYSTDNQLDFLVWELENTEKSAGDAIFNTDNVQDAAVTIVKKFLRPAASHARSRSAKYRNVNEEDLNFG